MLSGLGSETHAYNTVRENHAWSEVPLKKVFCDEMQAGYFNKFCLAISNLGVTISKVCLNPTSTTLRDTIGS